MPTVTAQRAISIDPGKREPPKTMISEVPFTGSSPNQKIADVIEVMQVIPPKLSESRIIPSDLIAKRDALVKKAKPVIRICAGPLNRNGNLIGPNVRFSNFGESRIKRRMRSELALGGLRTAPAA